jgi:formate dehydrogenase subunit delta
MSPEKLAYMANQIARFFAHQGEDQAAASTADHLRRFWEPRMRKAIFDYVEAGGGALQPIALQAVRALKAESAARQPGNSAA